MNYEANMLGGQERLGFDGEQPGQRNRRWIWIGLVALIVVAGAAFYFLHKSKPEASATAQSTTQIPTVTVAIPGKLLVQTTISGTGSLAAKRDMPVGVAGEGGMVTRVLVEPGAWVSKGQVLATVDSSVQVQTAESLAAQIRVAQSDAKLAQANLERAEQLVSGGFISKADIDQKTATRDQAIARVKVAQATLAETQARNRRLDIRAPEAGLILTRQVESGQIVSSGSGTLFRMAMNGEMEMRVLLAEADIQRLHVGDRAQVTPTGSTQGFSGVIWQVSPIIDPQTRQGIARVQLAYNAALRPGGFASASIVAGGNSTVTLPQSAVQSDPQGNYVYILNGKNETVRRNVTTGDVTDAGIGITSGLNGTERVVMTAGAFLNPGQKVIPIGQKK